MIKCYWQVKIEKNWNDLTDYSTTSIFARVVGEKFFELTNHPGNVHMTLSDYRRAVDQGQSVAYFSQVASASEYYPFGMLLTEGNYSSGSYRFGFQGQEMDNEVKGTGNSINFKYRMHDPRIGRFFALDPLAPKFPHNSPYAFAMDKVIQFKELEGLEIALPQPWSWGVRISLPRVAVPSPPSVPVPPVIPNAPSIPQSYPDAPSLPKVDQIGLDWEVGVPSSPGDLGEEWEDVTHPKNKGIHRDFKNKKTGEKIRWDPGESGEPGWKGKNHWHRYNPKWTKKMGKRGKYLDKKGKPVDQGSKASHIKAGYKLLPVCEVWPGSKEEYRRYYKEKEKSDKEYDKWIEENMPDVPTQL